MPEIGLFGSGGGASVIPRPYLILARLPTNREIRKMRFSIFGGEDEVEKKASK